MAKSSGRSAATSNAALTKKVQAADARVQKAQAQANLVRAQIEVKGKAIQVDWNKPGMPVKVVDRPR